MRGSAVNETVGLSVERWDVNCNALMKRLQRSLLIVLGVSALLTVPGLAQLSGTGTSGASSSATAVKPLGSSDRKFIKDAGEQVLAVTHLVEMTRHGELGSPELKKLNAAIKTDFDKVWGELGSVAQARKVDLPKTEVTGNEKTLLAKLRKMDVAKFDKAFLKALDKEMKKTSQVFEAAEKTVQEPELKTVAATWSPKVKEYAAQVATSEEEASKRK